MNETLVVSEVFGPTVQGEGPSAGRRCMFVRLGRCNLDCAWCDTPYTWDWTGKNGVAYDPKQLVTVDVDVVIAQVIAHSPTLVVISGGEPMLQRSGLSELVLRLRERWPFMRIEIETNGTQVPWVALDEAGCWFNVSPKLAGSGVDPERAIRPRALIALRDTGRAAFKFVVGSATDWTQVCALVDTLPIMPSSVWLMPQTAYGTAEAGVPAPVVAQWAIDAGFNYSDRLHVRLWGDERGR